LPFLYGQTQRRYTWRLDKFYVVSFFPQISNYLSLDRKQGKLRKNMYCRTIDDQTWISPTIYAQLLNAQIPKAQKIQSSCQSFLRFLDLGSVKLCLKCWWNWPQTSQVEVYCKNMATVGRVFQQLHVTKSTSITLQFISSNLWKRIEFKLFRWKR